MNASDPRFPYAQAFDDMDPVGTPRARIVRPSQSSSLICPSLPILDASFNPPTFAHVGMVELGIQVLGATGAVLVLSSANVDKGLFGASLAERLVMMDALAETDKRLTIATCSHARFVDKAIALRPLLPKEVTPYFVIGFDTLLRLFDPKYYTDMQIEIAELFNHAGFVAANRLPNTMADAEAFLSRPAPRPYRDRIHLVELDSGLAALSSTEARNRLAAGESVDGLVPDAVRTSIASLGCYDHGAPRRA